MGQTAAEVNSKTPIWLSVPTSKLHKVKRSKCGSVWKSSLPVERNDSPDTGVLANVAISS